MGINFKELMPGVWEVLYTKKNPYTGAAKTSKYGKIRMIKKTKQQDEVWLLEVFRASAPMIFMIQNRNPTSDRSVSLNNVGRVVLFHGSEYWKRFHRHKNRLSDDLNLL